MGKREVMSKVFSDIAKIYDKFLHFITLGRIDKWQKDLIYAMGEDESWLDVGTGTAEVLKKLKKSKLKVGIDVAYGMLKVAKDKCKTCYFVLADAESMPFKDEVFDRISLSLVFRHLENQNKFLKEARRTLRRGGLVGILDIRMFFLTKVLTLLMKTLFLPFGILIFGRDKWKFFIESLSKSFTLSEVSEILKKNGFEVIQTKNHLFGIIYIVVAKKI